MDQVLIQTGEKPTVPIFKVEKRSKVAIVGCADSKIMTPFNEPNDWEFWGVNNLHLTLPAAPWSRWFELHIISKNQMGKYFRRGKPDFRGQSVEQYLESLNNLKIPVYMQQQWPIIPNAAIYPAKEIFSKFGNYFTNTISYMIALAIMEGFKTIGIWGVDMAVSSVVRSQDEYSHQRPSCEYFIGLARGLGIEVIIPDQCDLLKTRFLYCYQEPQETAFNAKIKSMVQSMQQRQKEADNRMREQEIKVHQYTGAISYANEILKIWGNN